MNVLIAHASRHGSTAAIAREIGTVLSRASLNTTVLPIEHVESVREFDAVVLGSAVYYGHWLDEATRFVGLHQTALKERPVWLFSSGPIGEDPQPRNDPAAFDEILRETAARGHAIFSGKLQREGLNITERVVTHVVHAEEGDFRDWDEIHAWAEGIARSLKAPISN